MTDTVTINNRQVAVDSMTDDQKKLLNEAITVQNILNNEEYKLAVLKSRHELLVNALANSLPSEEAVEGEVSE